MSSKKIAYCGLLTTVALLLSYVERMLAIPMIVPGMKLGLANVAVLIALYILDNKTAFSISILRILISALLFTGFASFLYSASGALLSFTVMAFCKKTNIFSMIAVSILGGISHNIGQITIACVIVENIGLFYYMPFLIILGIATGFITGIVGNKAVYYIKNNKH
ncbi:MAG: Gx transporter family protein [Firmicutes bacterium]|jgi:heptaprenyl diphosphate synthase|nr:Gx transporter family protein [Bacillota bacterium]